VGHRAQRHAVGWLDEHDVGAEIGEHPSRDRGGLAGEVDDADSFEQWRGQRGLPCPRLSLTAASA
jgi:hypothetical protein